MIRKEFAAKVSQRFHKRFTNDSQFIHKGFTNVAQRIRKGFAMDSQSIHKEITQDSQRIHKGFTKGFTKDSHRIHNGFAMDSHRIHNGVTKDSQSHGGAPAGHRRDTAGHRLPVGMLLVRPRPSHRRISSRPPTQLRLARPHARTARTTRTETEIDFPVGLTPQPPIYLFWAKSQPRKTPTSTIHHKIA